MACCNDVFQQQMMSVEGSDEEEVEDVGPCIREGLVVDYIAARKTLYAGQWSSVLHSMNTQQVGTLCLAVNLS